MTSPPQLQEDFQALVDSLLSFAKSMLSEHGSFNPFGAVMYANGEIQWVAADTGEEFPSGPSVVEALTDILQQMATSGEMRAATICYDGRAKPPEGATKVDVISFLLEHLSGESINALIPYARTEKEDIQYGELFVLERPATFSLWLTKNPA